MQISSRKIRLGFIGAGFIGQTAHIENFAQLVNCELYAIADLREQLCQKVTAKFGFKKQYKTHQDLLADSAIDAVVVVTARSHTVSIVRDCLLAGKHVLSEKPMAGNSELARALVDLAEHSKLLYCVGYMKRYDDGVIKAKSEFDKLIINQSLGNLLQISAHCYMGDSYCKASGYIHASEARPAMQSEAFFAPEWLPEKHKDNFARYLNVHSHLLNLIRYFIEDTPSVEYFNYLNSKAHVCIMRTKQQLITVETGEVEQKDWQEKCTFIFEQGQLIVTLPPALLRNVPAKVEIIKNEHISEKVTFQPNWSWAFKNQAAAFITSLQNKELRNKISAIEALKDLELTENIWRKVCK